MKKSFSEDWEFTITVKEAGLCRMGFEPGDRFFCRYECPAGFCPKTMALLHSLCETARAGGDYRLLGGNARDEMNFVCADGMVRFHLKARHLSERTKEKNEHS